MFRLAFRVRTGNTRGIFPELLIGRSMISFSDWSSDRVRQTPRLNLGPSNGGHYYHLRHNTPFQLLLCFPTVPANSCRSSPPRRITRLLNAPPLTSLRSSETTPRKRKTKRPCNNFDLLHSWGLLCCALVLGTTCALRDLEGRVRGSNSKPAVRV